MMCYAVILLPLIASILSLSEPTSIGESDIRSSEPLFDSLSYLSNLYKKRAAMQREANHVQEIFTGTKRKDNEGEVSEGSSRFGNKNCFFSLVQCSFYYR